MKIVIAIQQDSDITTSVSPVSLLLFDCVVVDWFAAETSRASTTLCYTLWSLDSFCGMVDVYNYIIRVVNILTFIYLLCVPPLLGLSVMLLWHWMLLFRCVWCRWWCLPQLTGWLDLLYIYNIQNDSFNDHDNNHEDDEDDNNREDEKDVRDCTW